MGNHGHRGHVRKGLEGVSSVGVPYADRGAGRRDEAVQTLVVDGAHYLLVVRQLLQPDPRQSSYFCTSKESKVGTGVLVYENSNSWKRRLLAAMMRFLCGSFR